MLGEFICWQTFSFSKEQNYFWAQTQPLSTGKEIVLNRLKLETDCVGFNNISHIELNNHWRAELLPLITQAHRFTSVCYSTIEKCEDK